MNNGRRQDDKPESLFSGFWVQLTIGAIVVVAIILGIVLYIGNS